MSVEESLPDLPEPVLEWMNERATYLGWPPAGSAWFGLMRGRSLGEWALLRWEQRDVVLDFALLTHDTQLLLNGLARANFYGAKNEYTSLDCSDDKFIDIGQFISTNSCLPGELIFLDDAGRLEVVDGCHRLCLFFMLRSAGLDEARLKSGYRVWVGTTRPESKQHDA